MNSAQAAALPHKAQWTNQMATCKGDSTLLVAHILCISLCLTVQRVVTAQHQATDGHAVTPQQVAPAAQTRGDAQDQGGHGDGCAQFDAAVCSHPCQGICRHCSSLARYKGAAAVRLRVVLLGVMLTIALPSSQKQCWQAGSATSQGAHGAGPGQTWAPCQDPRLQCTHSCAFAQTLTNPRVDDMEKEVATLKELKQAVGKMKARQEMRLAGQGTPLAGKVPMPVAVAAS